MSYKSSMTLVNERAYMSISVAAAGRGPSAGGGASLRCCTIADPKGGCLHSFKSNKASMTLVDPPHSQSPPREEGGRERGTERERERFY
jgi:hypothetical protein